MEKLKAVIVYICKNYPYPEELTKARLTNIAYLCDWKSSLEYDTQITEIQWEHNYYGPYVAEPIAEFIESDPDFNLLLTIDSEGGCKDVVCFRGRANYSKLTKQEINVIEFIMRKAQNRRWPEFTKLVFSTYPILTQPRNGHLDLPTLAESYRRDRERLKMALQH